MPDESKTVLTLLKWILVCCVLCLLGLIRQDTRFADVDIRMDAQNVRISALEQSRMDQIKKNEAIDSFVDVVLAEFGKKAKKR